MIFSSNFVLLLVGEILMGLGVGADLPVSLATISEQAPDEKRGKMLLFSDILWVVGIVVAQGIGSLVGDWGLLGGQIMFGQLAAVSAIVLILRQTIPESPVWLAQNELRKQGIVQKEDTGKLGDLFKQPYVVPFIALVIFYIGTNVPANSLGQFSTWIGANVVEMPISVVSAIGMVVYPIRAILDFVFMHFVDTPKRMPLFYMGAILYLAGFLMFPIFGASTITYVLTQLLYCIGAAFAFEGILKVWMQECFPTLLRTTANGAIVFASRFSCAVIGFFTAAFITAFGYKIAFLALSAMCLIGFIAAIWCFHGKRYNTFEHEAE
jgi:inositol transporter-like SP family MFS transporter